MATSHGANSGLTIEEYECLQDEPGYRSELSRGQLVREPQPGAYHGEITGRVYTALDVFVRQHGLGKVTNQTGFRLTPIPRTVRGPDVAFVRRDRVPPVPPPGFWPFAPDLAVEVLSPSASATKLQVKIAEYFEAGTSLVWVVDPRTRTVTIYRSLTERAIVKEDELLEGGEIIPGFTAGVASLFDW